jgi:hypothetical protein
VKQVQEDIIIYSKLQDNNWKSNKVRILSSKLLDLLTINSPGLWYCLRLQLTENSLEELQVSQFFSFFYFSSTLLLIGWKASMAIISSLIMPANFIIYFQFYIFYIFQKYLMIMSIILKPWILIGWIFNKNNNSIIIFIPLRINNLCKICELN